MNGGFGVKFVELGVELVPGVFQVSNASKCCLEATELISYRSERIRSISGTVLWNMDHDGKQQ